MSLTVDPAARRFLGLLNGAAARKPSSPHIADIRAAAEQLAAFAAPAPPVDRSDDEIAHGGRTMRVRLYAPLGAAAETLPGLVFFHGGGFVAGDLDTHDALTATLAHGARCRVVAIDYARAPEAKFPAAYEDAKAATLAVLRTPERWRLAPGRVGVAGDSAGGQLAALAARAASEQGFAPALQFLLCPVMDTLAVAPSRHAMPSGYLLEEATMRAYWDAYSIEGLDPCDPRVSPLAAQDYSHLPPALVHVAEADPVRDEGELYAERLQAAGVAVKLTRHAGLIHHFYSLGGVIPAARRALDGAVAELAKALRS